VGRRNREGDRGMEVEGREEGRRRKRGKAREGKEGGERLPKSFCRRVGAMASE
jgi:hypothetical protein